MLHKYKLKKLKINYTFSHFNMKINYNFSHFNMIVVGFCFCFLISILIFHTVSSQLKHAFEVKLYKSKIKPVGISTVVLWRTDLRLTHSQLLMSYLYIMDCNCTFLIAVLYLILIHHAYQNGKKFQIYTLNFSSTKYKYYNTFKKAYLIYSA